MRQGDIYFADFEPTIGREQQGKRPTVIISPDDFNRLTGTPIVLPITNGGGFVRRIGFAVTLPLGLQTTGVVRCDQPRSLDLAGREARFVEALPSEVLDEVLQRFFSIFDTEPQ